MSFLSSQCNYKKCTQSQKMSIGIVVDSLTSPRNESRKQVDVSAVCAEKEVLNSEHLMRKPNVNRVKATSNVTVGNNDVQEGSVKVAAGSLGANFATNDNFCVENLAVRPDISSLHGKGPTHMLHSFANDALSEPGVSKKTAAERGSGKDNKRNFKDDVSKNFSFVPKQQTLPVKEVLQEQRTHVLHSFANEALSEPGVSKKTAAERGSGKEKKGASKDDVSEKFSFVPKQQTLPVKEVLQEQRNRMENRSKEALRLKLRELLGNVPSGNKKVGDSRTPEVNDNKITKEQTAKVDSHFKPWQNSDTIETDSENVDVTIKRPVTRSVTRTRAPASRMPKNSKRKALPKDKEENQGNDVFYFADKSPLQPRAVNRGCPKVEKDDHVKRSCVIKSGHMVSPVTKFRNIQPGITACEKAPAVEELPLGGGAKSPKYGLVNMNLETEAAKQNKNLNHSPIAREKSQQLDAESPAPQEKSEYLEPLGGQSPMPNVDDFNNLLSKLTKDVANSPMGSYQIAKDKGKNVYGSAQPEGGILPNAKCSSKSSTASEKDNIESSEDVGKLEDTCSSTPESSTEKMDAENRQFTPEREELDSTQEVSSAKKDVWAVQHCSHDIMPEVENFRTSPEIRVVGKHKLFQSKRHCSHDDDFSDFSPTLPIPKASGDADDVFEECFDECPEDGLARVVSLLGMALDKVKNKMMLVTNKRCSEILLSAAKEIESQLQNVESQIQTDLGKLTSLKTSKRKHLETRLQEQQEHLKVLHDKFKEEICQYLQDCNGAMEGLEAQHVELQGAIEKQKSLHRKLLLQTEAAVQTHLTDAQKQMMFVRKLGKQKMQQLKVVIAECLKDGSSS